MAATSSVPSNIAREAVAAVKRRLSFESVIDGFQNLVTGFGTSRSKSSAGSYVADPPLDMYTIESLLMGNDLAERIVGKIVEDALREPFTLERAVGIGAPEKNHEDACAILKEYVAKGCPDAVQRGAFAGRGFGGGGLILGVKGGGPLSTPLDDGRVTGLEFLLDWDRQDMTVLSWLPNGDPEVYRWTPAPKAGGPARSPQDVHASRLIIFPGANTTNRGKSHNQGWDHSVLQRVYSALKSFDGMFASTDAMFADASQAVFKLQGLIQSLAEQDGTGTDAVQTRLQLMDVMRSSTKAIMLDAGDETGKGAEDFKVVDRASLGTLDGVIDKYYVRLAAAARMPLTVLLGMSPAGMDATGESDLILYYNTVDVYRRQVLEARILRLVRMIARELGDEDPESWCLKWPELSRPKPLDVATAAKMCIDGVVALAGAQVLLPEEIAINLQNIVQHGLSGIKIDLQAREKALKEGLDEVANREMSGATAEEEDPAAPTNATRTSERKTPSKARARQA